MRLGKWGDDLAVRLPESMVESMGLKEGDEVSIEVRVDRDPIADPELRRQALERLRALKRPFPPGFKFSREEANER